MISLLQLQYFLAVAEEGHLTRTEEKMFLSQSTLSSMISKLESELGVDLFTRKNNRMELNEYGREYRNAVVEALEALANGERNIKQMAAEKSKQLSVALPNAQSWQETVWSFRRKHPECRLKILSDKMEQYIRMLEKGELDFLIAGEDDVDTRQCESIRLVENRLCLCVPPDHSLAARTEVFLKEIENEPYIELSPGLPFRHFCDRIYQQMGVCMNTVIECGYHMRPRLVREGYGVAITVSTKEMYNLYEGVRFIPLKDEGAIRSVNLMWWKGREFTPIMQEFYDFISKSFKGIATKALD